MKKKTEKIYQADEKLLDKEPYYRQARRAELFIGILLLICAVASGFHSDLKSLSDTVATGVMSMMALFCLASTWICDAKLKHISSIKLYREEIKQQNKAPAGDSYLAPEE